MPKMKVKTPSKKNKEKFEKAQKEAKRATEFVTSKGLGIFPRDPQDVAYAKQKRKEAQEEMESIPKAELDMMRMPESFEHGGAVKKKGKRSVDGCAIRGKTRAVRNV
jgi:hypothetical protein